MNSLILRRITPEEVIVAAQQVWANQEIASKVASDTIQILTMGFARKRVFFSGKSATPLVAGLFYLLSYRYGVKRNQKDIADRLSTSDVSVRIAYRNWLENFPDQFIDIIGKLAQDKDLRSYVLLNLLPLLKN